MSEVYQDTLADSVGFYCRKTHKKTWGVFHVDVATPLKTFDTYIKAEMAAQNMRVEATALWVMREVEVHAAVAAAAAKKHLGHVPYYHKIIDQVADDILEDMTAAAMEDVILEGDANGNTQPVQTSLVPETAVGVSN